jgi:DNA-directed RNA polymerase specialized sigma24 family protein
MDVTPDFYRDVSRVACAAARSMGIIAVDEGEQLKQKVLVKLRVSRHKIRSRGSLFALVYRAAAGTRISSRRSGSSYRARLSGYWEIAQRGARGAVGNDGCEQAVAITNFVGNLDPRTAHAIRRRFVDDQSYAAIGLALRLSNCTAHNLVQRGLAQLKIMLSHALAEEDCDAPVSRRSAATRRKKLRRRILATAQKPAIQTGITARPAVDARKERGQPCPA